MLPLIIIWNEFLQACKTDARALQCTTIAPGHRWMPLNDLIGRYVPTNSTVYIFYILLVCHVYKTKIPFVTTCLLYFLPTPSEN